jgi:hypothetical protein
VLLCLWTRQTLLILLIRLFYTFSSIGLSSVACSWFQDYVSDRTQDVVIDGVKSEFLEVCKGVPQGLILGPALFTTYCIYTPLVSLLKMVNFIYMQMIVLCLLLPDLI